MLDFEPPYDESAERALLGAMIANPENVSTVLEYLREDDFYFETHRKLFSLLCKIRDDKGVKWDDIVLREYLIKYGLDKEIDMSFIYALVEEAVHEELLEEAIRVVKEAAGLRRLMDLSLDVLKEIKEVRDFNTILDTLTHKVIELSQKQTITHYYHVKDIVDEVLEVIEKHSKEKKVITGVPSGFLDLDTITTGFHPSDFIVIAARPGMGKSSFMLSMAINIAKDGIPCAIYSLEMSRHQLIMRALSILSGVPLQRIRRGSVDDESWRKLVDAGIELAKSSIFVDDTPSLSVVDLRIKARKLKKEKGIGILFIDYLQLVRPTYRKSSRQEEVAEVSRSLKALAKELEIPVIALAQLSRQVEHRSDKRPQLADLRESGQIEQDADVVIFLHRPEYYKKNPLPEEKGIAEIIVAKQRQGPTEIIKAAFIKDTTAFKPLDYPHHQITETYVEEEEFQEDEFDLDF